MIERSGSYKKLGRLSTLGTVVLLATGCAGADNPANSFVPETFPTQSGPVIRTPDARIVSPEPTKQKEKVLAEQARVAMINSWLYTLNSGIQENPDGLVNGGTEIGGIALKVEATNLGNWENQKNLILNGGQSSEALETSWAGGYYHHYKNTTDGRGSKYFGQIETKGPQIANESILPLTAADIENGIGWRERIRINYIERFRSKIYWGGQGNYEKLKDWVRTFEINDLPNFTAWYQTFYEGEVKLQNEQWTVQLSQLSSRRSSIGLIKNFTIPYDIKQEVGSPMCGKSCVESFQTINIK